MKFKKKIIIPLLSMTLLASTYNYVNASSSLNDTFPLITHSDFNGSINTQEFKTYTFGQYSTEIYSPGVISITAIPNDDGLLQIEVLKKSSNGDIITVASKSINCKKGVSQTVKFNVSGYVMFNVAGLTETISGKYNVVW